MPYFPMLCNVADKKILIVGGGKVAKQKLLVMKKFCNAITVIAPDPDPFFNTAAGVHLVKRAFANGDTAGFDIVIAATDSEKTNKQVLQECNENKIPVNIVDDSVYSDFIFPAIYTDDDLVVSVSTSGKVPLLSGILRDKIAKIMPQNGGAILKKMESYRQSLKKTNLSYEDRKKRMKDYYEKLS